MNSLVGPPTYRRSMSIQATNKDLGKYNHYYNK